MNPTEIEWGRYTLARATADTNYVTLALRALVIGSVAAYGAVIGWKRDKLWKPLLFVWLPFFVYFYAKTLEEKTATNLSLGLLAVCYLVASIARLIRFVTARIFPGSVA